MRAWRHSSRFGSTRPTFRMGSTAPIRQLASTSPRPKSATARMMKSTPSSSQSWPKSKRGDADLRIDADGAEQHPGGAGSEAFEDGAADRGQRRQPEEHQHEVLGRTERQRDLGQGRREQHEAEGAEDAGDERADRGDAQGHAAAALEGHLVAVEGGHHRGRLARHVDQHRGKRAAVLRAVIEAGEHDDGGGGARAEGERQEQRDRRRGADARQHADDLPQQHAEEAHQQVHRRRRRDEPLRQVAEELH